MAKRVYKQRIRADRKVMNDLRRTATTIAAFEEREKKKAEAVERRARREANRLKTDRHKYSYTQPNEHGVSRQDVDRAKRLAALPATRKCPCCNKIKLNSAQWSVINGYSLCKSCWAAAQDSVGRTKWKKFFADKDIVEWICKNLCKTVITAT